MFVCLLSLTLLTFLDVVAGEDSLKCEYGYNLVEFGSTGSCYKMPDRTNLYTYQQAETICGADGATLVSTSTVEEYDALKYWLQNEINPSEDIWVGAIYSGPIEGPWNKGTDYVWLDGTPIQNILWSPNEPSASITHTNEAPSKVCIWNRMYKGWQYKLDNRAASRRALFVCEKECLAPDTHNAIGYWDSSEGIENERNLVTNVIPTMNACSTMYDHMVSIGVSPCLVQKVYGDELSAIYSSRLAVIASSGTDFTGLLKLVTEASEDCWATDGQDCASMISNPSLKQSACLWDDCGSTVKMICEFSDRLN